MFDMPPEPTQVLPDWLNSPARDNSVSANNSTNSLIQRGIENVGDRRNRQLSEEMSLFNQLDPQLPSQVINNVPTPNSSLLAKANERPDLEAGRSILPEPLPNFAARKDSMSQIKFQHQFLQTILICSHLLIIYSAQ